MYKDDPRIWNAIMNKVATEFQWLERYGIELAGNGRVYPIIVGNKGDWSYLVAWLILYITCLIHFWDLQPLLYNFPFPTKHLEMQFNVLFGVLLPYSGFFRKLGALLPSSS